MFGQELVDLVRRGVDDLEGDIALLEGVLAAARFSRGRFQDVLDRSGDVPEVTAWPGTLGGSPGFSGLPGVAELEGVLPEVRRGGDVNLMDALRVLAECCGGVVRTREAASALVRTGRSRSSVTNLAGYLGRKMAASGEFERASSSRGGVYRWLLYVPAPAGMGLAEGESGLGDPVFPGPSCSCGDPCLEGGVVAG